MLNTFENCFVFSRTPLWSHFIQPSDNIFRSEINHNQDKLYRNDKYVQDWEVIYDKDRLQSRELLPPNADDDNDSDSTTGCCVLHWFERAVAVVDAANRPDGASRSVLDDVEKLRSGISSSSFSTHPTRSTRGVRVCASSWNACLHTLAHMLPEYTSAGQFEMCFFSYQSSFVRFFILRSIC